MFGLGGVAAAMTTMPTNTSTEAQPETTFHAPIYQYSYKKRTHTPKPSPLSPPPEQSSSPFDNNAPTTTTTTATPPPPPPALSEEKEERKLIARDKVRVMRNWIGRKARVVIPDGRVFIGKFICFDKHKNVMLSDCTEFRRARSKTNPKEENKRFLGLALIPGKHVHKFYIEELPRRAFQDPNLIPGRSNNNNNSPDDSSDDDGSIDNIYNEGSDNDSVEIIEDQMRQQSL